MEFKRFTEHTEGPKVCKQISLISLHHNWQLKPLIQGRWDQCFYVVATFHDEVTRFESQHLNIVGEIVWASNVFPIFYCPQWDQVLSSVAIAHQLQGSSCPAFRRCSSASFCWAVNWSTVIFLDPWHQQSIFFQETVLTGCFLFFQTNLCNF